MTKKLVLCLFLITALQCSAVAAFGRERKLEFKLHSLFYKTLKARAKNFGYFFRPALGAMFQDDDRSPYVLRKALRDLSDKYFDNADLNNKIYIRLLRIHYGIQADRLQLIFEPVYGIDQNSKEPNNQDTFRTVYKGASPDYFVINNAHSFDPIANADGNNMIAAYQNTMTGVYINPVGINPNAADPNWRRFHSADIADGDARSTIIPFQEIEAFFKRKQYVYFNSVAERDEPQEVNTLKHAVILSDQGPATCNNATTIADLGSLCPVNCTDVMVDGKLMLPSPNIFVVIIEFVLENAVAIIGWLIATFLGIRIFRGRLKAKR